MSVTIRRDKLSWSHRKVPFETLPEIASLVIDVGEDGVHHVQVRPYACSIEIRDEDGGKVDLQLCVIDPLIRELRRAKAQILAAEGE